MWRDHTTSLFIHLYSLQNKPNYRYDGTVSVEVFQDSYEKVIVKNSPFNLYKIVIQNGTQRSCTYLDSGICCTWLTERKKIVYLLRCVKASSVSCVRESELVGVTGLMSGRCGGDISDA